MIQKFPRPAFGGWTGGLGVKDEKVTLSSTTHSQLNTENVLGKGIGFREDERDTHSCFGVYRYNRILD